MEELTHIADQGVATLGDLLTVLEEIRNDLRAIREAVEQLLRGVEDADECGVVGADGVGRENPAGRCRSGVFVGVVPVVVGMVPVVSVDDLGDRGAGGVVVDEVLAAGERGDEGLQRDVVDRAGVLSVALNEDVRVRRLRVSETVEGPARCAGAGPSCSG